jgi:NAD(P)-dependent dehydrogenase (short-subunit alcohol dehydrogenase family)
MTWTLDDIPPQEGRRAIVTGANSGIGWHAALELARRGADVTLACRSREKGEAALRRLKERAPGARARLGALDLSDLASVRAFADAESGKPLDLLVNNAGIMAPLRRRTNAAGHEIQFATNHLGHFALTALLLPALRRGKAPRVVGVASIAHRGGKMDFDDLMGERRYVPWKAYSQSKLANLLFAFELQRRSDKFGWGIMSAPAHPGVARTRILVNGLGGGTHNVWTRLAGFFAPLYSQSEEAGAEPVLYAATAPDVVAGGYYGPDGWREMRGRPVRVDCRPQAKDEAAARRLWELSETLTGVSFPAA